MKILKILLILLVPAIGIVGCKKSETKPDCHNNSAKTTNSNTGSVGSKSADLSVESADSNSGTLVGSGDDDRDGGDKRKKTR